MVPYKYMVRLSLSTFYGMVSLERFFIIWLKIILKAQKMIQHEIIV